MPRPVATFDALRKRLHRFLEEKESSRREVRRLLKRLDATGEIALFGGMLRDLALGGNALFSSDIDVVVDAVDVERFDEMLEGWASERNKFGGYRVTLGLWKVDVWPLSRTWALVNGIVAGKALPDLINTTFFNWDAILYLPRQRRFVSNGRYFEDLHLRRLDINLEPNPDPFKTSIRALRFLLMHDAVFTPDLAAYVSQALEGVRSEVLDLEDMKLGLDRLLPFGSIHEIAVALANQVRRSPTQPFSLGQVSLFE